MIQFSLKCANDHRFDSWFQSTDAYAKLKTAGMISCAVCGSDHVEKAIMAPRVRPARSAAQSSPQSLDGAATQNTAPGTALAKTQNNSPLSSPKTPDEQALRDLKRKVEENSEYVGPNFADKAREMHDGNAPERAIYGEAKPEEAIALIKEGIPVIPLPFIPAKKIN